MKALLLFVLVALWLLCTALTEPPPAHKDYSVRCPVEAEGELLGELTCDPRAVLPV